MPTSTTTAASETRDDFIAAPLRGLMTAESATLFIGASGVRARHYSRLIWSLISPRCGLLRIDAGPASDVATAGTPWLVPARLRDTSCWYGCRRAVERSILGAGPSASALHAGLCRYDVRRIFGDPWRTSPEPIWRPRSPSQPSWAPPRHSVSAPTFGSSERISQMIGLDWAGYTHHDLSSRRLLIDAEFPVNPQRNRGRPAITSGRSSKRRIRTASTSIGLAIGTSPPAGSRTSPTCAPTAKPSTTRCAASPRCRIRS